MQQHEIHPTIHRTPIRTAPLSDTARTAHPHAGADPFRHTLRHYASLRRALAAAYDCRPWPSHRIDALAAELAALEKRIAALQSRGASDREMEREALSYDASLGVPAASARSPREHRSHGGKDGAPS